MKTSPEGRKRLMAREGVRLDAYRDTKGIWTIGVGHTSAAGPPEVRSGLSITQAECDEIFSRDLEKYEDAVNRAIKPALAQNQFDACVSLCYNIGPSAFNHSSVVRFINSGEMEAAANAFLMWNKPPEIVGRRKTEVAQFKTPYSLPTPQPPPPDIPKPVAPPPPTQTGWLSAILSIFKRKL